MYLPKYDVFAVTRYAEVRAVLEDFETYCSGAGVGLSNFHVEKNWRTPSLLLESDPPNHTKARTLISGVLSPVNLKRLRENFYADACAAVDSVLGRASFDGVAELAQRYPLKIFPDAVGLATDGREHLLAYGDMAFNTMGPKNARYAKSMERASEVIEWVTSRCDRAALRKDGLGEEIYAAADKGKVSPQEAALLVRSFLTAGVDTTINALGNALYLFATYPEEWHKLRRDPSRARISFEEIMRFESPFQAFFRTTSRPTELAGVVLGAEQKVLVLIGAANRDPRRWEDADRFDVGRSAVGQIGFGSGIHACVGQMIARLEVELMLKALLERVESIELIGEPERTLHNTLRAFKKLPIRFNSAPSSVRQDHVRDHNSGKAIA